MSAAPSTQYFNTAACGFIDPAVKAVADELYDRLCTGGSAVAEQWRAESEPCIRETIARFLGAPAGNVALVPNFSWAMNGFVQSLRGDEKVLLYRGDYPSVLLPFTRNNFNIRWVDSQDGFTLPMEEIAGIIRSAAVDVVAISHVQYNSGFTIDAAALAALCREAGVLLILDATQSLGALPIDVSAMDIDVLIASNYKWMNAGFGTGILFMGDVALEKYPPVVAGNNTYAGRSASESALPIRSYEPGHPNMYGFTLLEASILQKEARGVAAIAAHNFALTEQFLYSLQDAGGLLLGGRQIDNRCSILVFRDEGGLSDHLRAAGMVVTVRGGLVRVSFHLHNDAAGVATLNQCFAEFQPARSAAGAMR